MHDDDERDCSICKGAHASDGEALSCVAMDWAAQGATIAVLQRKLETANMALVLCAHWQGNEAAEFAREAAISALNTIAQPNPEQNNIFIEKLDQASDVIWDEALPYMFDVEHTISSHADTLPQAYRMLARAIQKVLDIVNWRPDPG